PGRRRWARRPGDRLPAQRPRSAGRRAGGHEPRGDLVGLLPGLWRPQRRGPLRPDRAQRPVDGGWVPLRRTGPSPAGRGGGAAGGAAVAPPYGGAAPPRPRRRPLRPAGHGAVGGLRGAWRRPHLRAGAVGASAVGRLLVGDDRAAEAHRPLPRRDAGGPTEVRPLPLRR